jgi:hypothetical protein
MKKQFIFSLLALCVVQQAYPQNYSVDIPNATTLYTKQKKMFWCWAACNQMLLQASGIEDSQENQSIKLFGSIADQGAGSNYEAAKKALGGMYYKKDGTSISIVPYVSYLYQGNNNDPVVIINQLYNGIPLIMATIQHGYVCVGVDYVKNNSHFQITVLRLLDPSLYGSEATIEITMEQFLQEGLMGFMTYNIQ